MIYHFKVHKEKGSFWAQCLELSGCVTQGDTMKELQGNMQEALNLYVSESSDSEELATLPDDSIKITRNIVKVMLDPYIACAFFVRYLRIKYGLPQGVLIFFYLFVLFQYI